MSVLSWLRRLLLGDWFRVWSQVFVGELIAATKPNTDFRR